MSETERLKLKATFWNNIGVAAAAGGVLVPAISTYGDKAKWNATVFPVFSELASSIFWPMIAGFVAAFACRLYADHVASQIKN
jgi:hypothetical protein